MADDKDESIGATSPDNMRELLALLRWAKQSGFMLQAHNRKTHNPDVPRAYVAKVTEEVTAATETDWGKGKARLLYCPGEAGVVTAQEEFPPGGTGEIDVYTITSSIVEVDARIYIDREYASGKWIITVEDCV